MNFPNSLALWPASSAAPQGFFVDANASDKPRISASCNIMFRGYTQIMSRPLWAGSEVV